MKFNDLYDFANDLYRKFGKFQCRFFLVPDQMRTEDYDVDELRWESIHFGNEAEIEKVPDDKRGIYALAICHQNKVLPPHGYVIYIGIAGRRSSRTLRKRYKDYLNEKRVMKRPQIAYAIGTWQDVLRFYFAPVGDGVSSEDLEHLEKQMNAALIPPCSTGDMEADTKQKRKAFS